MTIFLLFFYVFLTCIIIWKASDGFEAAASYLGRHMTEGVKGATINAVASSMPELLTTFFFLFYLGDEDGFSGGIGTTAGSAIFNGMIIPAVVIFVVVFTGVAKRIYVSKKVVLRDGISLILAEIILITMISGDSLHWGHGLVLMMVYAVYAIYTLTSMKKKDRDDIADFDLDVKHMSIFKSVLTLNLASLILGRNQIKNSNAWTLLILSTLVIAAACLLLVHSIEQMGQIFDVPIMFLAIILASAASSVPDTILSMRDAQKGNYDDAVSNALGSNIFDISFALGLPLFLYTIIYSPIQMSPEVVAQSGELRMFLLLLTIVAFGIYMTKNGLGVKKGIALISIYIIFLLYIIGRSEGVEITNTIAHYLNYVVDLIAINWI
ncbi:MAG: sodium:calcium antiporter [Bacteroidales bacterium]|nr:sodium:calcium antiporter [Bacteroidales bacterium]